MFDGVPDQFHQFIASSAAVAAAAAAARATTTTLPLPLITFPPSAAALHLSSSSSNGFTHPSFDPFSTTSNSHDDDDQLQHHHQPHHFLHQTVPQKNIEEKEENSSLAGGMHMEINERERSMATEVPNIHNDNHHQHPWSNDEVLALLRIRSSMETWFPEFTWEHVSRKLAELGFKRSAEKCKEKFEEESSRYFNTINCSKNYRIFSELEELCQSENPHHHHHHHHQNQPVVAAAAADENNKNVEKYSSREDEDNNNVGQNNLEDQDDSTNLDHNEHHQTTAASDQDNEKVVIDEIIIKAADYNKNNDNSCSSSRRKIKKKSRQKKKKFEMLKGFCEDIVTKMMSQQEEMHNKLLQDMVKRDEEKVAREEAWKKQELDRLNHELELRAKEQAIAGDRQATIIKFLTKFASGSYKKQCLEDPVKLAINDNSNPPCSTSSSLLMAPAAQNPNPISNNYQSNVDQVPITTSSAMILGSCPIISMAAESPASQNPNPKTPRNPNIVNAARSCPSVAPANHKAPQNPTSNNDQEDLGKRWPRDEVLALINLRCSLYNNGDQLHDKEGSAAAAAIKAPLWERISQGMLQLGYKRSAKRCKEKWENINKYFRKTKDVNKKRSLDSRTCPYFHQLSTLYNQGTLTPPSEAPENRSSLPENHPDLPEEAGIKDSSTVHVSEGETNMIQVAAFEFEF